MEMFAWNRIIEKVGSFKMSKGLTSFINPYSMLLLENQLDVVEEIDFWHVDGISLVKSLRKKYNKLTSRFSFDDTSVAPIVFKFAKTNKLRIGIIGTKEEFIHKAVNNIQKKNNIDVAIYRNGYFSSDIEKQEYYDTIIQEKIDLVICGMGTPFQEKFLIGLRKRGWQGYGITCGGYLHQIAQRENYYPSFFNKLNIRWIYRIIDEPKLFKRYFLEYPKFFLKFHFFNSYNKKNISNHNYYKEKI